MIPSLIPSSFHRSMWMSLVSGCGRPAPTWGGHRTECVTSGGMESVRTQTLRTGSLRIPVMKPWRQWKTGPICVADRCWRSRPHTNCASVSRTENFIRSPVCPRDGAHVSLPPTMTRYRHRVGGGEPPPTRHRNMFMMGLGLCYFVVLSPTGYQVQVEPLDVAYCRNSLFPTLERFCRAVEAFTPPIPLHSHPPSSGHPRRPAVRPGAPCFRRARRGRYREYLPRLAS